VNLGSVSPKPDAPSLGDRDKEWFRRKEMGLYFFFYIAYNMPSGLYSNSPSRTRTIL
jgi:hypothetical protein